MKILYFFMVSLAVMLPINYLLAQDHDGINLVGEMYDWSLSGVHDIEIRGDYAFIADGTSAFQVLYIADPDEFKIAGQISDLGGAPVAVAIHDTLAFLAVENQGLTIIDISDPPDPRIISIINRPGPIIDVTVNDQYVLLLGTSLWVVAIDNPSRPGILGSVPVHEGREVLSDRNFAYVPCNYRDIYIIDFTDPSNPNRISEFEIGSGVSGIGLRDQFLFCSSRSEFQVIDIENPFEPQLIGETDCSWVSKICVNDQRAFCVGRRGLMIFNIEDPEEPAQVAHHRYSASELEPQIVDNTVYVPLGRDGINIYNVENVEEPVELNPEINRHSIEKVQFENNQIYLFDDKKILRILDFTNPDRMVESGSLSIDGEVQNLLIHENHAYISTVREGLVIADVSQPSNPHIVAQIPMRYPVFDVIIRGLDAYFITCDGWDQTLLYRVDIGNPSIPRNLRWIYDWYRHKSPALRIHGSNYFVALNSEIFDDRFRSGVEVIDASWDSLTFINTGDGITDIEIFGNILAVANESGHVSIFDISDLADVRRLSSLSASRFPVTDIKLTARYLYLAALGDGIKIYEITDPVRPRRVGYYDTEGLASSLDVLDHSIIVGDINSLGFYDCNDCTEVSDFETTTPVTYEILETFPNPFNCKLNAKIQLPHASPVSLDVYNIQGKLVQNLLSNSTLDAGNHQFQWNAHDLTSGTYFLSVQTKDFTQIKNVELIR